MTQVRRLTLVPPRLEPIDEHQPPSQTGEPFSLRHQPQRPGELCDWLELELSEEATVHLHANAKGPPSLWLMIAIEANRCLEGLDVARNDHLVENLDLASEKRLSSAICRQPARLLRAYAQALRLSGFYPEEPAGRRIVLTPSTSVVTAWEHHAQDRGKTLGEWIQEAAEAMPEGHLSWEAAAAERGQSLGEWILSNASTIY